MLGQERLVGRNDIFAALEHPQHDRPLRLESADEMCDDFYARIIDNFIDLIGENAFWKIVATRLFQIIDDRFLKPERPAGVPGRAVAMLDEQLGHALSDRAEAYNG